MLAIGMLLSLTNFFSRETCLTKKRGVCVWEGIKEEFSKDEFGRDGWHFCVICRLVCLCLCGRARKGDIHLVTTKDRVVVSSHLAPLSCKPLDRCMGNDLA